MNRIIRIGGTVSVFAMLALASGCIATKLPETSVDRVARAPELPNAPYERILIVGIAARGTAAREFEEELARELSNRRTHAFGYRKAAQRADIQEDVVRSIVAAEKADAIVVVSARLVDAEEVTTEEHTMSTRSLSAVA